MRAIPIEVMRSVAVGPSDTIVSCAQTAEWIEMPLNMGTRGDQRNIVLKFGPGRPNIRGTCQVARVPP